MTPLQRQTTLRSSKKIGTIIINRYFRYKFTSIPLMKFILYRYKETPYEKVLEYIKDIKNKKIIFSPHAFQARHYSLFPAIWLSVKYQVSWINEKYIMHRDI